MRMTESDRVSIVNAVEEAVRICCHSGPRPRLDIDIYEHDPVNHLRLNLRAFDRCLVARRPLRLLLIGKTLPRCIHGWVRRQQQKRLVQQIAFETGSDVEDVNERLEILFGDYE